MENEKFKSKIIPENKNEAKEVEFNNITSPEAIPIDQKTASSLDSLDKKIKELDSKIKESENKIKVVEKLNIAVLVAVCIALFLLVFDYLSFSYIRYEKFIDKIEEVRENYYPRNDLKTTIDGNNKNTKILDCLEISQWLNPKCFE